MTRFEQAVALAALAVAMLVCALLVEPYLLKVVGGDAVLGLVIGGGLAGVATRFARHRQALRRIGAGQERERALALSSSARGAVQLARAVGDTTGSAFFPAHLPQLAGALLVAACAEPKAAAPEQP